MPEKVDLVKQIIEARLSAGTPIMLMSRNPFKEPDRMVGGFIAGIKNNWITISYENPASPYVGARIDLSRGDRSYSLSIFNEFYQYARKLKINPENKEYEKESLTGKLDSAVGSFIILSNSAFPLTKVCGFVTRLSRDKVQLQHESPFYELSWDDTNRAIWGTGKRSYSLRCFDSYEVLNLMGPETVEKPKNPDRDQP